MKMSNTILNLVLVGCVAMSSALAAEGKDSVKLQSQLQVEQQLKQQSSRHMGPESPAVKKQIQNQHKKQNQYSHEKQIRSGSVQNGVKGERGVIRSKSRPVNRSESGSMGGNGSAGGKR